MAIIILIALVLYGLEILLNPEKHKFTLIMFAIFYGIFGGFYDASGAKSKWDRRKRG